MSDSGAFLRRAWAGVVGLLNAMPRKVKIVAVGAVLMVLQAKWPGADLPSAEFVVDAVAALLVCHTATDVAAIVATIVGERIAGRDKRTPGK